MQEEGTARWQAASEHELIMRAKKEPEAFGRLYDRYFSQVYRFVFSRLRDRSLAEDVTAEVFLKALRGIGRYVDTGRPLSCWLYRIALNTIRDHSRHGPAEADLGQAVEPASALPAVPDEVIRRDQSRQVWEAVGHLPHRQRDAIVLRFGEDLRTNHVAWIMGKSSPAIKLLVYRGVRRLRRELTRLETEPVVIGGANA